MQFPQHLSICSRKNDEMDTQNDELKLPVFEFSWYVKAIFVLMGAIGLASFYMKAAVADHFAAWMFVIMFALLELSLVSSFFVKKQRYLVASVPPVLVIESRWFGRFTFEKKVTLNEVKWVRVVYAGDAFLHVEVGTWGHQTTVVCPIPYSSANIALAESVSKEIAKFLYLTDKGYAVGMPRG